MPLAGFLAGIVIWFHYFQFPLVFLLFFYLLTFLRDRRVIFFFAAAAVPIAGILLYHWSLFGNPLLTPYSFHYHAAFYSVFLNLSSGSINFTYPSLKILYSLTFSPFKGLFIYCPILLLALYGLFIKIRSKWLKEMWLILSIFLVYLFLIAEMREEIIWSGTKILFGPRHLLPVVPFLMLPLIFVFHKIKNWLVDLGVIFLSFASIFINYLGVSFASSGRIGLFASLSSSDQYNLISSLLLNFVRQGPKNKVFEIYFTRHLLEINILGLLILGLILFIIYQNFLKNVKMLK